jgi:hypothetical protein
VRRHVFEAARFWERAAQFTGVAQLVGPPEPAGAHPAAVGQRWEAWRSLVRLEHRYLMEDADPFLDTQVIRFLFEGALALQADGGTHVVIVEES